MATAEELLLAAEMEPQAEEDQEEAICVIDPETREISVPARWQTIGVESDEKAERIPFRCPKIVGDGIDLSLASIRIVYRNANGNDNAYLTEDARADGDQVTFSWELRRAVTEYKGAVSFIVCAIVTDADGTIEREWNTTLAQTTVLEGLESDYQEEAEAQTDIVMQLLGMVREQSEAAVAAVTREGTTQKNEITELGTAQKSAITQEGTARLTAIQSAGTTQLENVNAAGTTQVGNVNTAGAAQVAAVQAEGATQITAVQQSAAEIVEDRDQIQKNAEDIAALREQKVDLAELKNIIIQRETGVAESHVITGSAEFPMLGMQVYGRSEQETTTGAQLFDASQISNYTGVSFDVKNNEDGSFTISEGSLTGVEEGSGNLFRVRIEIGDLPFTIKAGTLTMRAEMSTNPYAYFKLVDVNGESLGEVSNRSFSGSENAMRLEVTENILSNLSAVDIGMFYQDSRDAQYGTVKPMLYQEGDGTWEPYTGGIPSPNPDYPQEIVSAGQVLTTGAQLFDAALLPTTTKNGITLTNNGDGSLTFAGTADGLVQFLCDLELPAGTYCVNAENVSNANTVFNIRIDHEDGTRTFIHSGSFEIADTDTRVLMYFQFSAGTTINETAYIMLNSGSAALPWEPYTGGQPALVDAGIQVEVYGGNLLSDDMMINVGNNLRGLNVEVKDSTVTFSGTYTAAGSGTRANMKINVADLPPGTYTVKSDNPNIVADFRRNGTAVGSTVTISEENRNGLYMHILLEGSGNNAVGDVVQPTTARIILNVGSTAHPWEPYKSKQSLILATPDGLPGIPVSSGGNYTDENGQQWVCDEIDLGRGVYVQRVCELMLDGSEVFLSWPTANKLRNRYMYKINGLNVLAFIDTKSALICDFFRPGTMSDAHREVDDNIIFFDTTSSPGNKFIGFCSSKFPTLDEFKEFLTDNPITVLAILATPIETDLTTEEIAAYRALHTNNPTATVIAEAPTQITYAVDPERHIAENYVANAAFIALEERVYTLESAAINNI